MILVIVLLSTILSNYKKDFFYLFRSIYSWNYFDLFPTIFFKYNSVKNDIEFLNKIKIIITRKSSDTN